MSNSKLLQFQQDFKITMKSEFVPWSKSINKDQKNGKGIPMKSLNWNVTICRDGVDVVTFPYSMGSSFAPAMLADIKTLGNRDCIDRMAVLEYEIENGKKGFLGGNTGMVYAMGTPILPPIEGVLNILAYDATTLDYNSFEHWADEHGLNPDSRSAEACYKAALKNALSARNGLGEDGLRALIKAAGEI